MLATGLRLIALCGCTPRLRARIYSTALRDNDAFTRFEMAPGLHYVGSSDIAVFAIRISAGLIVIDSGYAFTLPSVVANLKRLGFDPHSVKLILNTHAHVDHAAGLARLKHETGAQLYVRPKDADLLEAGGRGDFFLRDWMTYPKVTADRRRHDGEVVQLSDMALTAQPSEVFLDGEI